MTTDSLRKDVLRVLDSRADAILLTILGRGGRERHLTGSQIRTAAEGFLDRWQTALGPGARVQIAALPPGEDFLMALVASLLGEGTLVPVALPRAGDPPDRLQRMVRTCGAEAILCHARHREVVGAQIRDACQILVLDRPEDDVLRPRGTQARPAMPYPIVQHTSGSTRFPRAVPVGPDHIRENCEMIRALWGMGPNTVMVNWLPHYHDMGLMGCILYPLLCGAHSVQMSPFDMIRSPVNWLNAISKYRGTISGGPAFAFQECLERISPEDIAPLDLRSWECAFCGAEPIPAGMLTAFADRFAAAGLEKDAVFACYGMAESTLFAAGEPRNRVVPGAMTSRDQTDPVQPGPVQPGPAVDGCLLSERTRCNLRITDTISLSVLPDGSEGEIWISGLSLVQEYLGQPEETALEFVEDENGRRWFRTGDLGVIHGRQLFITGRSKDVIIVNGRNVAAAEIEWISAAEDEGLNPSSAAAFVPLDSANGHAVLFIEWRPHATIASDTEALAERIRRSVLSKSGVVLDEVRLMRRGSLPRTTSGKIRRAQVRGDYARNGQIESEGDRR